MRGLAGGLVTWTALGLAGLALAGVAWAAEWGGIVPGETTRIELESRYGRPSRERSVTEDGRTVPELTYAGDRAPRGIERMVVSFGLLRGGGFVPEVVRSVALHVKPRIFTVEAIVSGWGKPDQVGTETPTGRPTFFYGAQGLLVILDRSGEWAELMLFGPAKPGAK